MSADRHEIHDDGPCIRIVSPDSTISTIVGRPVGYHIDDAVIGAIRQQASDIAELRADLATAIAERDEAHTAYQVRNTEWHQHELIALALAERYKLRAEQAEMWLAGCGVAAMSNTEESRKRCLDVPQPWPASYRDCLNASQREIEWRQRAEQAEARLAAIDAAPVVAHIANKIGPDYFPCGLTILADRKLPPLGTDLIVKPAKD